MNFRRINLLLVSASAVLCNACTMAPLSYLEAKPPTALLPANHYPVRVVSVDGSIQFHMPVQLSAGEHALVLEAAPGLGVNLNKQHPYTFKVEPCTRYYLLAERKSSMDADWELVVHSKETVSACNPADEMKKVMSDSSLLVSSPKA